MLKILLLPEGRCLTELEAGVLEAKFQAIRNEKARLNDLNRSKRYTVGISKEERELYEAAAHHAQTKIKEALTSLDQKRVQLEQRGVRKEAEVFSKKKAIKAINHFNTHFGNRKYDLTEFHIFEE